MFVTGPVIRDVMFCHVTFSIPFVETISFCGRFYLIGSNNRGNTNVINFIYFFFQSKQTDSLFRLSKRTHRTSGKAAVVVVVSVCLLACCANLRLKLKQAYKYHNYICLLLRARFIYLFTHLILRFFIGRRIHVLNVDSCSAWTVTSSFTTPFTAVPDVQLPHKGRARVPTGCNATSL